MLFSVMRDLLFENQGLTSSADAMFFKEIGAGFSRAKECEDTWEISYEFRVKQTKF
jgi:hypothetical protein